MTPKIFEGLFKWQGFGNGFGLWESRCYLQISVNPQSEMTVAVATDLGAGDNGTSVTNAAEHLAGLVSQQFEIIPEKLTWIEHYLGGPGRHEGETFDLVSFQRAGRGFSNPSWRRIEKAFAEELAGCRISYPFNLSKQTGLQNNP